MAQINRRPTAVKRAAVVDPTRGASGAEAESLRSSILGAPSKFRSSTFDPDTATLEALRGRGGEISKAMAPPPAELSFSDTGEIRDIFRQPPPVPDLMDLGGPGGFGPGGFGPGFGPPPVSKTDTSLGFGPGDFMIGKALTTGRILREHPDKFKSEGDPSETGGRFFKRIPAIKRRPDMITALHGMPDTGPYGTPGGMKFVPEEDYLGRPDFDPFFRGI